MIRINCKADNGKRRAGMHHPKGALDHADGVFTDEQLARIEADPDFSVQRLEGEPTTGNTSHDPVGELEDKMVALGDKLLETRSENDRLATELDEATSTIAGLTTELDEARTTIETLTAELAEARKPKAGKKTNKEKGSK